jgi:hypothetical protein
MELYIQIVNGQPFQHPIMGDNFRQAFPDVDVNNLPSKFAKFVRVELSTLGVYDLHVGSTYEWQGGVVTDAHQVRAMTAEEITAKQNTVKADWAQNGFASWVFNETTCTFEPPIPYPTDSKLYRWNESTTSWMEA